MRIDFDEKIGAHFIVMVGKRDSRVNYHLTFPGSVSDVSSFLRQFQ